MRMMALVTLVGLSAVAVAQTRGVDFTQDTAGQPPKGFELGYTAKVGAPGKWVIQIEGNNKFLAQLDADRTRSRFPVAVLADIKTADVDLSVRFRPVSGRVDQAAGLVWRYRDENNYYIHNGKKLFDVEDTSFTQAGKVGLWTKADSVTHFDDLTVVTQ